MFYKINRKLDNTIKVKKTVTGYQCCTFIENNKSIFFQTMEYIQSSAYQFGVGIPIPIRFSKFGHKNKSNKIIKDIVHMNYVFL